MSLNTTIYTEIKIITTKINIPDKYHEDRRKLKIFIILYDLYLRFN